VYFSRSVNKVSIVIIATSVLWHKHKNHNTAKTGLTLQFYCKHHNSTNLICFWKSPEIWLSMTNRTTHFVQMQWCCWHRKIYLSPHWLPCLIWSLCIKGRRNKYRTPKIGERWNSVLLWWEAWPTPRYTLLTFHVKFGNSVTKGAHINRKEH